MAILRTQTMRTPLAPDVDLQSIGQSPRVQGFSGADLAALAREAAVLSLKVCLRSHTVAPRFRRIINLLLRSTAGLIRGI